MIKYLKFGLVFLMAVLTFSLTACSEKVSSLYPGYVDSDNVFEIKTADEINELKGSTDLIYVFYADNDDFTSCETISIVNEQAKQFNVDVIYYLDAKEYNVSKEERKNLQTLLGINDASFLPSLFVLSNNQVLFDLSRKSVREDYLNDEDSSVNYQRVCGYIFRELPSLD